MNPHAREQLPRMMLYLRHQPVGRLPTLGLVQKSLVLDQRFLAGPSYRASEQLFNVLLQNAVGRNANRLLHAPLFQSFLNLRLGQGRIRPKRNFLAHLLLSLDLGQQHLFPAVGTMDVPRTELGRQSIPFAVE